MKKINLLNLFLLLVIVLLDGCSVTKVPDDVMNEAIKKDVNLRLMGGGHGSYIFKDTVINEFEATNSREQETPDGTYESIDYTANVTLVDSKTLQPVQKEVKGIIEFHRNEGHWWYESVKLPVK